jgi:hypothetical protein
VIKRISSNPLTFALGSLRVYRAGGHGRLVARQRDTMIVVRTEIPAALLLSTGVSFDQSRVSSARKRPKHNCLEARRWP